MGKLEIARSFNKTIQFLPFEPINTFMSIKVEIDDNSNDFEIKRKSEKIYKLCKETVESDIEKIIKERDNK